MYRSSREAPFLYELVEKGFESRTLMSRELKLGEVEGPDGLGDVLYHPETMMHSGLR